MRGTPRSSGAALNPLAEYRIEGLLGRGGMSVVYLAEDLRLRRRVALKVLAPELASDARFRERFLRESELAASIDHPNIIPIYEAGEADGRLFIAMRYVEGTDLKALLRTQGALEPPHALAVASQIADALDAAHERGLVHRDVKPSNVLLGPRGHSYLSDFGLTKSASERVGLAGTGLVGTVDYVAPEQIRSEEVDGRTDLYSFGCLLFECLTGEVPFAHASEVAVVYAQLEEEPPRPSERLPGLPIALDTVLARAMAKLPDDRYDTCRELVDAAADSLGLAVAPSKLSRAPALAVARHRRRCCGRRGSDRRLAPHSHRRLRRSARNRRARSDRPDDEHRDEDDARRRRRRGHRCRRRRRLDREQRRRQRVSSRCRHRSPPHDPRQGHPDRRRGQREHRRRGQRADEQQRGHDRCDNSAYQRARDVSE